MLCDGSLTPLLTHLARASDLTDQDRTALRAIVDEPEPDANMLDVTLAKKTVETSVEELPQATRARLPGNGQGSASRSH